jgi:hypothetical protein
MERTNSGNGLREVARYRRPSCTKVRYEEKADALWAIDTFAFETMTGYRAHRDMVEECAYYHERCDAWHITSMAKEDSSHYRVEFKRDKLAFRIASLNRLLDSEVAS